jgi:hypothetical protein
LARSSRLTPEQRAAGAKLRRSGLTKSKNPNYIKRLLRQPEIRAFAIEGRAKPVKMSAREAKAYKEQFTVKGRTVLVPVEPGQKVYSRRGQIRVQEPTGETIRIPPPSMPAVARPGELYVVRINGNVSHTYQRREDAEAFLRQPGSGRRLSRTEGVTVEIVYMTQAAYDRAIADREDRRQQWRQEYNAQRRRNRAAVRAAVRPIR